MVYESSYPEQRTLSLVIASLNPIAKCEISLLKRAHIWVKIYQPVVYNGSNRLCESWVDLDLSMK